jgi:hypothetical protein
MAARRYTREQVDAILGRALREQHDESGMTHEELVAAAKEVGVSAEQIERAARDVKDGQEIEQRVAVHMRKRWRAFGTHLVSYLLVMAFLGFVNFMTTGYPWVVWPAAGWGLGLAFHLLGLLSGDPEKIERKIRKREQKRVRAFHADSGVRVQVQEERQPLAEDDDDEAEGYAAERRRK